MGSQTFFFCRHRLVLHSGTSPLSLLCFAADFNLLCTGARNRQPELLLTFFSSPPASIVTKLDCAPFSVYLHSEKMILYELLTVVKIYV